MKFTWLYALYCKHGQLCYVGIASNIHKEMRSVSNYRPATIGFRTKLFSSRFRALVAKGEVLVKENPPWNGEAFPAIKGLAGSPRHKDTAPCKEGCL